MGIINKSVSVGWGFAAMVQEQTSRDKLDEMTSSLENRGSAYQEEVKQEFNKYVEQRRKDVRHIKDLIRSEVHYWTRYGDQFVDKKDFEELATRLQKLESEQG